MVALFATMSFALTSCGDDDDDVKGASAELTIDGKKYVFNYISSNLDLDTYPDYGCSVWNQDVLLSISIHSWEDICNGYTWTPSAHHDVDDCDISLGWGEAVVGSTLVAGSVKVNSIDEKGNKITLTFNQAKFEDWYGNNFEFTVNGTITLPIDGAW